MNHIDRFAELFADSPVKRRILAVVETEGRSLITNSAFLVANTLTMSFFGFLFWLVAARSYTPEQVGIGAASISAVSLLTTLGEGGLNTALIRFAPGMGRQQTAFINTALIAVAVCTLAVSGVFALGTLVWAPELSQLISSGAYLGPFLLTGVFFSLGQLLDNVLIAFQSTRLLFVRNLVAAAIRLAFVLTVGRLFGGMGLLLAVGAAALLTFVLSALVFVPRVVVGYRVWPSFNWSLLRDKLGYALGNHLGALLLNAPALTYPLIVMALLGAKATAHFYTSAMIANILLVLPEAVARSAFARASNHVDMDGAVFWQTMRRTLIVVAPITLVYLLLAPLALHVFGRTYAEDGSVLLWSLVMAAVPDTVTLFVIIYHRIHRNTRSVIWISGCVAVVCFLSSIGLGAMYGLVGVGFGLLAGQGFGAIVAVWTLRRNLRLFNIGG